YGIFTPIEISKDENCAVCGKKRGKLRLNMKKNSTLGDMVDALKGKGMALTEMALITKVIDGSVIAAPNQHTLDRKLSALSIQNHDILRATYTSKAKDGKLMRKQEEFIVVMED
ncbi:MAG: hypothetical protein JSV56_07215, partial [Methanomassiliicoccales archaeon]